MSEWVLPIGWSTEERRTYSAGAFVSRETFTDRVDDGTVWATVTGGELASVKSQRQQLHHGRDV